MVPWLELLRPEVSGIQTHLEDEAAVRSRQGLGRCQRQRKPALRARRTARQPHTPARHRHLYVVPHTWAISTFAPLNARSYNFVKVPSDCTAVTCFAPLEFHVECYDCCPSSHTVLMRKNS